VMERIARRERDRRAREAARPTKKTPQQQKAIETQVKKGSCFYSINL
jgi:hypothetical protein